VDDYWEGFDPRVDELFIVAWRERADRSPTLAGFEPIERRELGRITVTHLRASRPRRLRRAALARLEPGEEKSEVTLLRYGADRSGGFSAVR
jgi:hypothetical protein